MTTTRHYQDYFGKNSISKEDHIILDWADKLIDDANAIRYSSPMSPSGHKISFEEGNKIMYRQTGSTYVEIPCNIEFIIMNCSQSDFLELSNDNLTIYVNKKDFPYYKLFE